MEDRDTKSPCIVVVSEIGRFMEERDVHESKALSPIFECGGKKSMDVESLWC